MNEEHLKDAREELKRADHLIYVSLKYTRTVDVFISIFERLINFYGFVSDGLIEHAIEDNPTIINPVSPLLKCEKINEIYDDEEVKKFTEHYLLLRKVLRSDYDKAREFRRHVTMTSYYEKDKKLEITTDIIEEWFASAKEVLHLVRRLIMGEDTS